MPAPPAGADRDEGMAVDPVLIAHEAEEMPADAMADMNDAQARRRLDQGVQSGGHVQPTPVRVVDCRTLQVIRSGPGDAAEVIGQHRRSLSRQMPGKPLVEALGKARAGRNQHRDARLRRRDQPH
ncbi:hypothetical protein D3C85_1471570 [compost metagenome]